MSAYFGGCRELVSEKVDEGGNVLMAACINLTLFKFLISQRVPQGSPALFTDTLTSHRRDPSSMLPSLAPTARRMAWRART